MEQKELEDYLKFLDNNLTSTEKMVIAIKCECSTSTVYNYLSLKIGNKFLAKAIVDAGTLILEERGIIFANQINEA